MPSAYENDFGEYCEQILSDLNLSIRKFAEQVSMDHSYIAKIIAGKDQPPESAIETWPKALKLSNNQTKTFIELAWLRRSPAYTQQLVVDLKSKIN